MLTPWKESYDKPRQHINTNSSDLLAKVTHKGNKIRLSYYSTVKIYKRRNIMREFKIKIIMKFHI